MAQAWKTGDIMTKKTNSISSKEFATIAKNATKQIKEVTYSPFFILNTLNKVVKGDVSKIVGMESINVEGEGMHTSQILY